MFKLLTEFSNLLFPPRLNEKTLKEENLNEINKYYTPSTKDDFIYLSTYTNPVIKAAILENKFHNNKTASKLLGEILLKWLEKQSKQIVFVPIPLGGKRQRERGYNQVENILASEKIAYVKLLKRTRNTPPQSSLKKQERLKNINKAFSFNDIKQNYDLNICVVILDDVVTTGTTLTEAKQVLKNNLPKNVEIKCLAIAH
jgi:competence protein ComFC